MRSCLRRLVVGLVACLVLGIVPAGEPDAGAEAPEERLDEPARGRFVYGRRGARVVLEASPLYAAVLARATSREAMTPPEGLELDERSRRPDLRKRGVTLFRVPNLAPPRGIDTTETHAWRAAFGSGGPVQPVFELGAALRIPSDEIVIAFDASTTRDEAVRMLSGVRDELRIGVLLELRPGVFVSRIRDPAVARVFEVSRRLSEVPEVVWAEPSFINVFLETPGGPPHAPTLPVEPGLLAQQQTIESRAGGRPVLGAERQPEDDWLLVLDGHFEGAEEDWIVARDENANRILPVVTRDRAHAGSRAVYMSGKGLAGNRPPEPYAEAAGSHLTSPIFGLLNVRDAFVELWFWARFEAPRDAPRRVYDFARVLLYDVAARRYLLELPIAPVGAAGDLTRDHGTDRGWRRLLFRVPEHARQGTMQLVVHFVSDGVGGSEGLFVDDIRVMATQVSGRPSFSRDPAAEKQYALMPAGQIAGRPSPRDPSVRATEAWSLGYPERDVIVALLDDGVERGHPDLAFWKPLEETGEVLDAQVEEGPRIDHRYIPRGATAADRVRLFPGEPESPDDRHGTACAGVLGAIANNGRGIAGVAPGALLLPLVRGVDDLSIVLAIDAAAGYGAHVLVIPWGWSGAAPQVITRAIVDAIAGGTIVVAAAGDGVHRPYDKGVDYPCSLSDATGLICVGASSVAGEPKGFATADGQYWWASALDSGAPDLLAPGTWLHATDRQGPLGYNDGSGSLPADVTDAFAGTGAAACYVGGVTALMAARDEGMSPEEARRLIGSTASRLPAASSRRGELRLVDPAAAVQAAIEAAVRRRPPGREN